MSTELNKRDKREVSNTAAEQIMEIGRAFEPDVDIYVSEDEAVFIIDLPGVKKGDVNIEVTESDALVVKASNSYVPTGEPVLKQFNIGNYYRSFQLSNEYNKEKISGKLENGLLEIRIPKKEEAKPKRIEINA